MLRTCLLSASVLAVSACSGAAAPEPSADGSIASEDGLRLVLIAEGLEYPWAMAEIDEGDLLVTEREGRLRLIDDGALVTAPISGLPDDILAEGQGGLMGLALDPEFATNGKVYICYSKDMGETNTTAVISATLSADRTELTNVKEIFKATPRETSYHFGGRLAFLPDGSLMVTLGDGYRYMNDAQNPDDLHGALARIWPDGSLPEDNPFAGGGGHPALWSYGHRNIQGIVYDASRDALYAHEHGPKGGDEINLIEPGNNYGWPTISYGINYDGTQITDQTAAPGLEQPLHKWVPSIAPSGMTLVETAGFEDWAGQLLVGGMNGPKGQRLVRLKRDADGTIVDTEDLLEDLQIAYRDVLSTPTALYVATADFDGAVYRLEPLANE